MKLLKSLLLFPFTTVLCSVHLRGNTDTSEHRELQGYYYETTSLGAPNISVTVGNPMKGLTSNPKYRENWPSFMNASLHIVKLPMNAVMKNDPDVVGTNVAFNWTAVDEVLQQAEKYFSHVILRFYIHWPSRPLSIPSYLTKPPYNVTLLNYEGEIVPWYGDANLRNAIRQFIREFGKNYDRDTRLFAIQAGFLGAWGEWHTQGCVYNGENCDPPYVENEIIAWYGDAFNVTHVQFRRPEKVDAYNLGFGYHDDSYTYITVGGEPNGGLDKNNIFWTSATQFNTTDFWKRAPMGGEMRPENMDVFTPTYPVGTPYHQDFNLCTQVTHATYMAWSRGFTKEGVAGLELQNALFAWAQMGYSFMVDKVSVATSPTAGRVDIDVTLKQIGVAPFYYPLWLNLYCGGSKRASVRVIGDLTTNGNIVVSSLRGVTATSACLSTVELRLSSTYVYTARPIKWAQGLDGRVFLNIPLP